MMASNLASLLSTTTLTDSSVLSNDLEWSKRSNADMQTIRHLPPTASLVLFTPVISPPSGCPGGNIDPFEPLGRCLSNYHAGIRHVPYVPSASGGFTSTHSAFVGQGSAIIVVVCVVDGIGKGATGGVRYQARFAEDLSSWAKSWNIVLPMVLVKIGKRGTRLDIDGFSNEILCRSYSTSCLDRVASAIFGA